MPVEGIKWNRNGLCGAACAHMVLHARGRLGTTRREQEDLWDAIKRNTTGQGSAPAGAECSGFVPEVFDDMIHDACTGKVLCWCTYPTALTATLTEVLGAGVPITLSTFESERQANSEIRDCLNRGAIPIVLVKAGNHWVIVDEWDDGATHPVNMVDPAVGHHIPVKLAKWKSKYMAAINCVGSEFHGQYVIVQVGP